MRLITVKSRSAINPRPSEKLDLIIRVSVGSSEEGESDIAVLVVELLRAECSWSGLPCSVSNEMLMLRKVWVDREQCL